MTFRVHHWGLALLLAAPLARAQSLSFVGSLADPNDVFVTTFTLMANSQVTIQTWGFGGSANAPGGTNAGGQAIPVGGFDPYVSLFLGSGAAATFIVSNDDGTCPPGRASPACADSTLILTSLAAGTYTLALTLPFNFSFAENYGSGMLGYGFIGLDSSFGDGSCATSCSSDYAVDIRYAVPVPEPATWAVLLGLGPALFGLARCRSARLASSIENRLSTTEEFA